MSVNTLLHFILYKEHLKELSPDERNENEIAPETVANCKKLAQEFVTDIKNCAKKAANKSNCQCFSPRQTQIALLSMYANSSKGVAASQNI